jgi:Tol biopolymer transport system component
VSRKALVALALLGACSSRVDLQSEARGIPWEKLSGRIAYSRWDVSDSSDPRGLIFLVDVKARKLTVVRNVPTQGKAPTFESTGWVREVAFNPRASAVTFTVLNDAVVWELRSLSLDSGAEEVLFPDPRAHHLFPAWSADGRLAYYSNGADGVHLFVDGRFSLNDPNPSRVAWDGSNAFFVSVGDASSAGTLYLADPQAQALTPVITGTDISEDPAVDPARRRLAYVRRAADSGAGEIWLANIDGTGQTRATRGFADYNPAWSADGQSVLFVRFNAGLFLYHVATGSITQVTHARADSMAWAP